MIIGRRLVKYIKCIYIMDFVVVIKDKGVWIRFFWSIRYWGN